MAPQPHIQPLPSPGAALQAVSVPLLTLDAQAACLWANQPAQALLGRPAEQLAGRPLWSLIQVAQPALRRLLSDLHGDAPASLRAVPLQGFDPPRLADVHLARFDGPVGATGAAFVVTLVDTTARAAAESEVIRLRAGLAESERARQRLHSLQEELTEDGERSHEMVGASAALERVRAQVARVAPTDTTVLIHGETGSGKELVARSIHSAGARRAQAFIAVNCAALPESLIESELFGHEKGAFTGADRRRLGKFELADGGTLFLDEVAELPLQAQAKLLRVIQESAFERVGGAETVNVNVRLIAATHRDLARQVERGRFREDLYYRLNVFRIDVPPLRDRKEDLRPLAAHLHERIARRMGRPTLRISDSSLRRIMAYHWPGNVRELANAVERATLLADGPDLEIELPEAPLALGGSAPPATPGSGNAAGSGGAGPPRDILLDLTLEQLQRLQITHALESCGYRVFGPGGAAQRLDLNPNTLLSKMDKFGIPRPRFMKRARKS